MKVRIKIETEFGWGERRSHEIGTVERRSVSATEDDIGLSLVEGHSILRTVQRALLQDQIEELSEIARVCRACGAYLPVHDRRSRQIDTLFGRVTVEVPRVRVCQCRFKGYPDLKLAYSPLTELLPAHATPELRRLQAEMGARHSFREAARLLSSLTPCDRQNHMTIRNRVASMAKRLETGFAAKPATRSDTSEVTVFLDSAYVRARPEYQRRNFEVIVGCIETGTGSKHRFGLNLASTDQRLSSLRHQLEAAGWCEGAKLTVLSDGDPALPRLIRDATGGDVDHILDWWHISARIRHVEMTFQTLASHLDEDMELAKMRELVERLRWRIWHGQIDTALKAVKSIFDFAWNIRNATTGRLSEAACTAAGRALDLRTYLTHNPGAIANYGRRQNQGKAVSTSRAEGLVNDIANARMGKKQRMRWSPKGAHRVATVRAAALDGRLSDKCRRAA